MDDLVEWPGNPRVHDDQVLDASIETHGQFRMLLTRELPDGRLQLLAGHGTREALRRSGRTEIEVEVRDVPDDAQAGAIVLMENRANDRASYDTDKLVALLETQAASDWGLDGTGWLPDDIRELLDGPTPSPYTFATNVPQYEPVGPEPPLTDLWDETRARELHTEIDAADIPDGIRAYLHAAAARHVVFDYRRAAEWYPHQSETVQHLMERSALVIIDVGDAIRLGYARLVETVEGIETTETDDDDEA